jgi:GR25 family glycosyltransferase involved in LPS biosynthesis
MGCSKSHVELYKLIDQGGFKNTLILEDDFIVTENFHLLESSFGQLPEDYGFFYLGHYNCFTNNSFSPNLTQISQQNFAYLHGTHAISVQPSFAKKLAEVNENLHFTADGLISHVVRDHGLTVYAALPCLVNQDLSLVSDTVNIDKKYN